MRNVDLLFWAPIPTCFRVRSLSDIFVVMYVLFVLRHIWLVADLCDLLREKLINCRWGTPTCFSRAFEIMSRTPFRANSRYGKVVSQRLQKARAKAITSNTLRQQSKKKPYLPFKKQRQIALKVELFRWNLPLDELPRATTSLSVVTAYGDVPP